MRDAGVAVLAGSDTPNNCISPGFALHWELELLVEAGLTPYEALRSATTEAARALGREAEGGLVAPGYWADLVLFDANPLEDIGNAKSIRGVVTAGRWHDAGALDAMRRQAENAAGSSDESPDLD
jgi:imidazolonepropionase-like amidohydrolase